MKFLKIVGIVAARVVEVGLMLAAYCFALCFLLGIDLHDTLLDGCLFLSLVVICALPIIWFNPRFRLDRWVIVKYAAAFLGIIWGFSMGEEGDLATPFRIIVYTCSALCWLCSVAMLIMHSREQRQRLPGMV